MSGHGPVLNLAAWQEHSVANGPGDRYALWAQGCDLLCPGCVNARMQPPVRRHVRGVEDVARAIRATPGIEGVTFTGGEPTRRAHALARLAELLRPQGLSVVCYTGFTLEALRQQEDPWVDRLLACTDILIDGPYVRDEAACLLWRGSRNQRVWFLTERYGDWAERVDEAPAQVEISLADRTFQTTGTWPAGFVEDLERVLRDGRDG